MDEQVKQAKRDFLGQVAGVASWIERRVSAYLSVQPDPTARDNQIVSIIMDDRLPEKNRRGPTKAEQAASFNLPEDQQNDRRESRMAEREAFFEGLPADKLAADEENLFNAMMDKLSRMDGSARLNVVLMDEKVKRAKVAFL